VPEDVPIDQQSSHLVLDLLKQVVPGTSHHCLAVPTWSLVRKYEGPSIPEAAEHRYEGRSSGQLYNSSFEDHSRSGLFRISS